jgi:hypothetical protein
MIHRSAKAFVIGFGNSTRKHGGQTVPFNKSGWRTSLNASPPYIQGDIFSETDKIL